MPRIAVVGSANMDLVVRCDALPRTGETVMGFGFSQHSGGKGANQAVAAGRLSKDDTEVFFVGCVGKDEHGMELLKSLTESKVNLAFCKIVDDAPTGIAVITVDGRGNNTIVVSGGANETLTSAHVTDSLERIKPDIVLAQLEVPDEAVYACAGHGRLILDPAPARILDREFMAKVEVVTPNETETQVLTGLALVDELAKRRAAKALLEAGVKHVVLTLGEDGVFWTNGTEDAGFGTTAGVEPVDTTAAGDAFAGALAVYLVEGEEMESAVDYANMCAQKSAQKHGAQESMPWRREISLYDRV
jgi:ribokinase